ncbi:hypothetical protein ABHI18_006415 [Aspergillus niger]
MNLSVILEDPQIFRVVPSLNDMLTDLTWVSFGSPSTLRYPVTNIKSLHW